MQTAHQCVRWGHRATGLAMIVVGFLWGVPAALGQAAGATAPPVGVEIRDLAFSPDGRFLAAATGLPKEHGQVILWDLGTRQPRWVHEESEGVPAIAFSSDGKWIAIAVYDHTAKLLDPRMGNVHAVLRGHDKEVRTVAFAPDARTLATGSWDTTIKLWSVPSGELQRTWQGHNDRIFSVEFSPDGKSLVSAGEQLVKIWDVPSSRVRCTLNSQNTSVFRSACFSPDGRWVATACWDGMVRIWHSTSGALKTSFGVLGAVERVAFLPGEKDIAVCTRSNAISLFHVGLDEPSAEMSQEVQRLIVQLDDDSYAVRENAEKTLQEKGLAAKQALGQASKDSRSAEVRIRARRLLRAISSAPFAQLNGHVSPVNVIACSPAGTVLTSGSKDGTIKLWDPSSRKEIASFQTPAAAAESGAVP